MASQASNWYPLISRSYEGIFIKNDTIVSHTDSVIGIRFINLSPNSTPLDITLLTSSAPNEVSSLDYKINNEHL